MKNEIMKFLGGRRSGDKVKNIFISKIFFFRNKFFSNFIFKPSTPKKFHDFVFHPLGFNGVVGERIWQASSFSHPQRFVGKKVFFKISFPPEMKSQTPNLHSNTSCSALISNFLSSSRSNQNIFHSSGWRMDFTFSRNSRDNRK